MERNFATAQYIERENKAGAISGEVVVSMADQSELKVLRHRLDVTMICYTRYIRQDRGVALGNTMPVGWQIINPGRDFVIFAATKMLCEDPAIEHKEEMVRLFKQDWRRRNKKKAAVKVRPEG